MNPYISIWFNTRKTIDEKLKSDWLLNRGFIPYLLFGLNYSIAGNHRTDLIDIGIHPIINFAFLITIGALGGLAARAIGVNILFYMGKLWNGPASKNQLDTVLSLSLIPEIIISFYLLIIVVLNMGDLHLVKENYFLTLLVYIFGLRILIIGVSRVQKFSYGLALLNIWLPQIAFTLIFLIIREAIR